MTDNQLFIHRIGRGMSIEIQHRNRRAYNWRIIRRRLLLLALAVLLAVVVLVACVSPTQAATRPPLCHRTMYGVRVQHFALKSTWQMHRTHGDRYAVLVRGAWRCR